MEVWWPFTSVPRAYAIKVKGKQVVAYDERHHQGMHLRSVNLQRLIHHGRWCLFENLPGGGGQNWASNDSYGVPGVDRLAKALYQWAFAHGESCCGGSSIKMVEQCSQDHTTGRSVRLIVFS